MYMFRRRTGGMQQDSFDHHGDGHPIIVPSGSAENSASEPQEEDTRASRERLVMAVNHMTAFVVIFYIFYAICRFGLGWDPIHDAPPPTFTIEIPGITDAQPERIFLDR